MPSTVTLDYSHRARKINEYWNEISLGYPKQLCTVVFFVLGHFMRAGSGWIRALRGRLS